MLWLSAAHGLDLATPERRAGLEQTPARGRRRRSATPMSAATTRRRCASASTLQFGAAAGATAAAKGAAALPVSGRSARSRPARRQACSPIRWSAGADGARGRALARRVLLGALLLHPEIAAERLESLAQAPLPARACRAGSGAHLRAGRITGHFGAAELQRTRWTGGAWRGRRRVLDKLAPGRAWRGWPRQIPSVLRRFGTTLPTCVFAPARYLSSGRQPPQRSLRESNEVNLSRLRDIQEQDQRSLRPDQRDETEEAVIVHPFKRR